MYIWALKGLMKEIVLISGLGADKRVFNFLDLSGYKTHCIEWLDPLEDESIENYATRLRTQITIDNPVIIGVSFGGVMAIEIGKQIPVKKIILISSVENKTEIPLQNRWIGIFKLNKIIPAKLFNKVNDGMFWFFGVENENEKQLLRNIMGDTNPVFLKWGVDRLLNWRNETEPANVVSIHGSEDRLFPGKKADYIIEGGGHLMIINKSEEISVIVRKELVSG